MTETTEPAQGIEARSDGMRSSPAEGESPTRRDAPPRIPDEIVEAIDELIRESRAWYSVHDAWPVRQIRTALDSTILRHLSGALAARDKLRAEREHTDLRIRAQRARLRELEPCVGGAVATDGRIRLLQFARTKAAECRALRREKTAALARAERLEKALADPVAVHVNMLRGTIAKPSVENIVHL